MDNSKVDVRYTTGLSYTIVHRQAKGMMGSRRATPTTKVLVYGGRQVVLVLLPNAYKTIPGA